MNHTTKKLLSFLLTAAIIIALAPASSPAAIADGAPPIGADLPAQITAWETMAAEFEQNLAAFELIASNNGFLAPITPIEELPDFADYIPISDRAGLEAISSNLDGKYYLTADIDLAGQEWVPIGVSIPEYSSYISINAFSGVFDGQGHTISNLTITGSPYQEYIASSYNFGLFSSIDNATIKNVGLVDTNIDVSISSSNYSSIFAGGIAGGGSNMTISNCYNAGEVICSDSGAITSSVAGGIFGSTGIASSNNIIISDCYNTGNVAAISTYNSSGAGGIIGVAGYSIASNSASPMFVTISNCYNAGEITATSSASGIVNTIYASIRISTSTVTIDNCYNSGEITCPSGAGIVGSVSASSTHFSADVTIRNCYNAGEVTGSGIVNSASASSAASTSDVTIENCYNAGDVSSVDIARGAGIASSVSAQTVIIRDCYNTGTASGAGIVRNNNSYTSTNTLTISNCYNAGDVSGAGIANGISAQTVTIRDCYNTGAASGAGIVSSTSSDGTTTISNCYNTGNITASWRGGGIVDFVGDLMISNCYNTGDITASNLSTAGGIVGSAGDLMMSNCYNTGDISISNNANIYPNIGGVVGSAGASTISNCYNIGSISVTYDGSYYYSYVGGLLGRAPASSTISNCYNAGDISYSGSALYASYVGGIAGSVYETATIIGCATISAVIAANGAQVYSDKIANGLTYNASDKNIARNDISGAPGGDVFASYPISAFLNQSTYTAIGWDFDTIWSMPGGENFPVLQMNPQVAAVTVSAQGLDKLILNKAVSGAKIVYRLTGAVYASAITPANFTISGLPAGLVAGTPVRVGSNTVEIPITGSPTVANATPSPLTYAASLPAANFVDQSDPVIPTGNVSVAAVLEIELGDINGDGEVNILDVDKLFRYVTGQIPSL
jgi:hypothetical protein